MKRLTEFPGSKFIKREAPHGFGLRFKIRDDGLIEGRLAFDPDKEGPPGHVHGGAIAAVLDEAMGVAVFERGGRPGMTLTMTFDYKKAILLGVEVQLLAQIEQVEGRKYHATSTAYLPDGEIAVEGRAVFLQISDALFEKFRVYFSED